VHRDSLSVLILVSRDERGGGSWSAVKTPGKEGGVEVNGDLKGDWLGLLDAESWRHILPCRGSR
jgi:hypothetical protein